MPNWPKELVKPGGYTLDTVLDPEDVNEFDERILTLASTLRHQGVEQWTPYATMPDLVDGALPTGPGGYREGTSHIGRVIAPWKIPGQGGPSRRGLAAFGRYGLASQPSYALSTNGSSWDIMASPLAIGLNTNVRVDYADGNSGNLVVLAATNRSIYRFESYDGGALAATNVVDVGHVPIALHYALNNRLFVGDNGGSNLDKVLTSDNGGVTWTRRNFGTSWIPRVFASDGAGNVACIAQAPSTGPGQPIPKLMISNDNGVSWDPVINPALGGDQNIMLDSASNITDASITYVPDPGAFVAFAGTSIYRSLDGGQSWQRRIVSAFSQATSPFSSNPTTPEPAVYNQFLAAIGPCLAACCNWNMTSSNVSRRRPAVVVSFDLGDTWKLIDLGPTLPDTKRVTQIKAWNERFVVGSQGVVYMSGLVASSPGVDFSADG